jgi:hypothetical protein
MQKQKERQKFKNKKLQQKAQKIKNKKRSKTSIGEQ